MSEQIKKHAGLSVVNFNDPPYHVERIDTTRCPKELGTFTLDFSIADKLIVETPVHPRWGQSCTVYGIAFYTHEEDKIPAAVVKVMFEDGTHAWLPMTFVGRGPPKADSKTARFYRRQWEVVLEETRTEEMHLIQELTVALDRVRKEYVGKDFLSQVANEVNIQQLVDSGMRYVDIHAQPPNERLEDWRKAGFIGEE